MGQDDVKEALENGEITRGDLQRNAMNVLHFILGTPSILRFLSHIGAVGAYHEDIVSGRYHRCMGCFGCFISLTV